MKKLLLTTCAVLAMATLSHGAAIRWGVANNAVTWLHSGTQSSATAGMTIALVLMSEEAAIREAILDGTFGASTAGVIEIGSTSNTRSRISEHEYDSTSLTAGTWYNFGLVAFDSDGTLEHFMFTTVSQDKPAYAPGEDPITATFSGTYFAGGVWEPIPEPATAGLLALGLAALALRRRRVA